jgi:hypothetical protein
MRPPVFNAACPGARMMELGMPHFCYGYFITWACRFVKDFLIIGRSGNGISKPREIPEGALSDP